MHQRLRYFAFGKKCLQRRHLIALYVHQKTIRRIRRQARLPRLQQIIADQRQRQQRHQAQPQRDHLHDGAERPPPQIGDAETPTDAPMA